MAPDPLQPTSNEPEHTTLNALSTADIILKTALGFLFFVAWILLFIFGISLKADYYRDCIFPNDSVEFRYLFLYAATFTPINVAMLSALAGVLGGFASNLAANNQFRHTQPALLDPKSDDFTSYVYMTENPLVSMLRGFITYLIFIAGSYLTNFTTSADPNDSATFIGLTASSYFKFAVSVSLLAYLAGYDPSRMKSLINSVSFTRKDPVPANQTTVTHQTTESVQVATTGATPASNGQLPKTS